jgi:hypothetical protein
VESTPRCFFPKQTKQGTPKRSDESRNTYVLKGNDWSAPTIRNATQWLREHSEFKMLYGQSIESRLDIFEDEVVTIPDDASKDFKTVVKRGKPVRVADPEQITRSKLRVDVRFRHLKAYRPQKWGDVSTLVTKDATDNSIDALSMEDLEKKIASMELKNRIVKAA